MCEKRNEFRVFAARIAFATCVTVAVSLHAGECNLGEFNVLVGTNAVINVESGDVAVIDRLSGKRGTITKTGDGLLRICEVENEKVRFEINGGKVLFDRPRPSALEKAFFHVDSSRADTLITEEENGTNFVVRWNDVRGNGMFATNCMYKAKWRSDPENRRAFISSVTQNGMPVVDFGEMLLNAYTNSLGESRGGYGASMIWSEECTCSYEVYQVVSDTPDVALLKGRLSEAGISGDYRGVSFLSLSWGQGSSRRANLIANGYPNILQHISSNNGWLYGCVYLNKTPTSDKPVYGKKAPPAGFNLIGFTTREDDAETEDNENYTAHLDSFARDYIYSFGGQRLAEYLVFTNRLDAAERASLQDYLHRKWKGTGISASYRVSSISVAEGASVEMAPGVTVSVASVSDGANVSFGEGSFELNPLKMSEANFHVDASLAESLSVEVVNGTNFVNHWADVLSNGVYATAASAETLPSGLTYLPDPENRRPFISSETLNGLPVVDFGSLLFQSRTNEFGYGIGYGASMKWSKSGMDTWEVFTVTRDTDDVKDLGALYDGKVYGMSHICIPDNQRLFRGKLASSGYPNMFVNTQSNNGGSQGVLVVDGGTPITGERNIEQYRPNGSFQLFNFQLAFSGLTPNWFGHSNAKDGESFRSFGGTKIAEYIALPALLDEDVRQAVHSALRTKWFGIEKREITLNNLTVGNGAEVKVPWNTVSVSGTLSIGGEFDVSEVSAANLSLTGEGAGVSGTLTVADGAEVEVRIASDGRVSGLSAETLVLAGGGSIALSVDGGAKMPECGSYPVLSGVGSFEGLLSGWELDATVLARRSCTLELRQDGIYLNIAQKGLSFVIR